MKKSKHNEHSKIEIQRMNKQNYLLKKFIDHKLDDTMTRVTREENLKNF